MLRMAEWQETLKEESSLTCSVESGSEAAPGAVLTPEERSKRIERLFVEHNAALIRFLSCRLKSAHEAKEVAQEAYVRMLQLDSIDGVSYLQAFLFKTASHLAADRIKSGTRRARITQLKFFDVDDFAPAPEDALAAKEAIDIVLAALQALPPKCRYAFVMHRFHGHTITAVAQLMSISERMVRLYIERAVVFCRNRLVSKGGAP